MFTLVNGKPKFFIGKINGIGYSSKKERDEIINRLKKEDKNKDIEIVNEKVEIGEELKAKAIKLGELQLTHSKSEFMDYLFNKKTIPEIEILKLKDLNKKLEQELSTEKAANQASLIGLMEISNRVRELEEKVIKE